MAIVIPAADLQGTYLNAVVTNITNLVAANPLTAPALNDKLNQAQIALVLYLISSGSISAATVLAGATYIGSPHPLNG